MAQLDQNLCRRKTKKKERRGKREKKEEIDVFKCPPTKPTSPHTISLSLVSLSSTNMLPEIPFCNPPKKPHLHHCLSKQHYFSPSYVGSFGVFVVLVRVFTEKTGKQETSSPSHPSLSPLLFSSLSFLFLSLYPLFIISSPTLSSFFTPISSCPSLSAPLQFLVFGFWVVLLLSPCDLMKKMKGVVSDAMEDQRTRFKHHSLMQDYEELQKDAEATKKKLQMMKQKKSMLAAEVRFLRRRYKYLMGNQSMNPRPKQDVVQTHNLESQRVAYLKGKSSNKKEFASRYSLPALDLNKKEKFKHGMEDIVRKPPPKFDLNLNARAHGRKEATLRTPTPNFDLNQKERVQSGKESTKRKNAPVFDLNQISREEEEEFQANCEPMRMEEPNKSLQRGGNDEQHNDMKLLACRTIGNGSNRSGKRKITWQDQVALRV